MLTSLQIEGYRGFERRRLSGLGRVNLMVGTNNSGKTSVLEAIQLLASAGDPFVLVRMLARRGERLPSDGASTDRLRQRPLAEYDLSHIFNGNETQPGRAVHVASKERWVKFAVSELSNEQASFFDLEDGAGSLLPRLSLDIGGAPSPPVTTVPLSPSGGLMAEAVDTATRRMRVRSNEAPPAILISPESMTGDELISGWNKISLTPHSSRGSRAHGLTIP